MLDLGWSPEFGGNINGGLKSRGHQRRSVIRSMRFIVSLKFILVVLILTGLMSMIALKANLDNAAPLFVGIVIFFSLAATPVVGYVIWM